MSQSDNSDCKSNDVQLPVSRIKLIMKSSPGVEAVSQESAFLATKATELFIQDLVSKALQQQKTPTGNLEYKDIAEVVQTSDHLGFLKEVIPRKVTVEEAKAKVSAAKAKNIPLSEWREAYDEAFFTHLRKENNE